MMKILPTLAAVAAAVTLWAPANAEEPMAKEIMSAGLGPEIGAAIPHDLNIADSNGEQKDFDALTGENGMALFFIRSVDWCPYCKAQAIEVDVRAREFEDRGLSVVFLSYDEPMKQQEFIERRNIKSVVLSDTQSEVIKSFGLLNENYERDSRAYGVPHPAVFIVNNDKTVAAKLYEEDFLTNAKSYRNRPAVDLILDAVDEAVAAGDA
ncbi:MAG: peroxiredoxin family protein [Pseudomonadota bacterium]